MKQTSPKCLVTDLGHFLDSSGEIVAAMPRPARQLASFLVLVVDAVTQTMPATFTETRLRCTSADCRGTIIARVDAATDDIQWHCPACHQQGVVSNWQNTKWDMRPGPTLE